MCLRLLVVWIFLFLISEVTSCQTNATDKEVHKAAEELMLKKNKSAIVRTEQERLIYNIDSFFITIAQNIKLLNNHDNGRTFDLMFEEQPAYRDSIKLNLDTIIYSPDHNRMICTVISESPRIGKKKTFGGESGPFYCGLELVGFRDSIDKPFKLYNHNGPTYMGYTSKVRLKDLLRLYLFQTISRDGTTSGYDTVKKAWIKFVHYERTVDEPEFWECPLWQKGLRAKGKYNFQLVGNVGIEEIAYKEIPYPDSLYKRLFQYNK